MILTDKDLAGMQDSLTKAFNRICYNPKDCGDITAINQVTAMVHLTTAMVALKTEIRERKDSQYSPSPQTQFSDMQLRSLQENPLNNFKALANGNYSPEKDFTTWTDTYVLLGDLATCLIGIEAEERKRTLSAKFSQQQPVRNTPTQTTQPKTTNTPAQSLQPTPEDLQFKNMYAQGPYKKPEAPKWYSLESDSEKFHREAHERREELNWTKARHRLSLELTPEEKKMLLDNEIFQKDMKESSLRYMSERREQYKKDNAAYLLLKHFEK